MKKGLCIAGFGTLGFLALGTLFAPRATAQDPILVPVIAGEAAPIVAKVVAPKPKHPGTMKFEGYFLNGNVAQVTLRAKGNEMGVQTFPLTEVTAAKMQKIIEKGGYQYGDKLTVYYDPQSGKAVAFKGKPSRPL